MTVEDDVEAVPDVAFGHHDTSRRDAARPQTARELLERRLVPEAEAPEKPPLTVDTPKRSAKERAGDPVVDFLRSRQGQRLQREVVRGVFGMLRKRL
jgi:hypothetical protein